MSGSDPAKVNAEFFADGRWKANFLINLGYGDASRNYPRGPRLPFDSVVRSGVDGGPAAPSARMNHSLYVSSRALPQNTRYMKIV